MDSITVRNATLDDLPKLLEFQQGVVDWERPYDPTIAPDPISYYNLRDLIKDGEKAVLVAVLNNNLIGCGLGMEKEGRHYLNHSTYAYLGLMYTDPKFRGKGINAMLIDRLKGWALNKGLTEIRLTVYSDNVSAIKAYEKVGFKKHIVEMRLQ